MDLSFDSYLKQQVAGITRFMPPAVLSNRFMELDAFKTEFIPLKNNIQQN
jgi:hypothetical protein